MKNKTTMTKKRFIQKLRGCTMRQLKEVLANGKAKMPEFKDDPANLLKLKWCVKQTEQAIDEFEFNRDSNPFNAFFVKSK